MNEPRVVESVTNECQSLGRAHESSSARAEELIACLEGEIAKRDARISELEAELCERTEEVEHALADLNNALSELASIKAQEPVAWRYKERADDQRSAWLYVKKRMHIPGGHKFEALYAAPVSEAKAHNRCLDEVARLNASHVQRVSVPDERIIPTSAELIQWAWEEEPEETRFQEGYNAAKRWVKMQIEAGIAAPAAPAADAGIVDMYRHLQKVTPYRFKKIQDASITDGGDVMYFHKDRFDAALLADMAAHSAKGVV